MTQGLTIGYSIKETTAQRKVCSFFKMKSSATHSGLLVSRRAVEQHTTMWQRILIYGCVLNYFSLMAYTSQAQDGYEGKIVRATVQQGTMRGKVMTSERGRLFFAFQGIPFALPPVGQLRFKTPKPLTSWNGELDATKLADQCIQYDVFLGSAGKEDCLYLNVYTPQLSQQNGSLETRNGELLDVMFWIFGGLFASGSPNHDSPRYLMDKNVVLVSLNYRLGVFGFLSTGDDESPGNYGMKDQLVALKWVKENIAAFGGNPNSITIFGHSAGAASVHYHLLSPLSRGLFHRAISMAGTAIEPWARCVDPLDLAKKQARLVDCPTYPNSALIACLRDVDAHKLASSIAKMFVLLTIPATVYTPCKEERSDRNVEPFLPADPLDIIRSGNFSKVPWLVGANSHDVAVFIVPLLNLNILRNHVNQDIDYFSRKLLFLPSSLRNEEVDKVFQKITEFYKIGNVSLTQDTVYQYIECFTDRLFIHGVKKTVELHSLMGHHDIFWYNFAYRGLFSNTMITSLRNYGVAHGDEQMYLFSTFSFTWPDGHSDLEVREIMLSFLTNFAKYGNPTPLNDTNSSSSSSNSLLNDISWVPVGNISSNNMNMLYFNIGQVSSYYRPNIYLNQHLGPVKLNMAVNLNKKRMDFWDSLPLNEN